MAPIYLDHNATTPVAPEVREAMLPYLGERFGNPSSGDRAGQVARDAVERARAQVAALIGGEPQEIVFTSGGTEANNLALVGHLRALAADRPHVVASAIEHPSVLEPLRALRREGVETTLVSPRRDGRLDPDEVVAAMRPETALVTIMHSNNELGTLQPVAEVVAEARRRGVRVHTDAAQSVGKVPLDAALLGVELLSLAGHKLHAPKGIGALWIRPGTPVAPLLHGGGQEGGLRPGTEPVPGAVGLGAACELVARGLIANGRRLGVLRDRLEVGLTANVADVQVNGAGAPRLPTTSHLSFLGIDGARLLAATPEIAASTGSACHTGDDHPSPVLAAIGATSAAARGALRLSLGRDTTETDIERAIEILTAAATREGARPSAAAGRGRSR